MTGRLLAVFVAPSKREVFAAARLIVLTTCRSLHQDIKGVMPSEVRCRKICLRKKALLNIQETT